VDIALIGVIATFVAFRIAGITTGRGAGAPLNRKKFLIHLGILVLLSSYCIVLGIIKISSEQDRKRQEHLAALRWKSESLTLNGRAAEATTAAS
jgi:tetratricopeptide (TPR) repeat protein